jgi:hypothetical protein
MNSARTHDLGDVIGLALSAAIEKQKLINDIYLGSCSFTNQTGLALAAIEKNQSVQLYQSRRRVHFTHYGRIGEERHIGRVGAL